MSSFLFQKFYSVNINGHSGVWRSNVKISGIEVGNDSPVKFYRGSFRIYFAQKRLRCFIINNYIEAFFIHIFGVNDGFWVGYIIWQR